MMGPKKLSTIREELRRALAATGEDPIRRLEECMAVPESQDNAGKVEHEVLRSLRRLLAAPAKRKRRSRVGSKK